MRLLTKQNQSNLIINPIDITYVNRGGNNKVATSVYAREQTIDNNSMMHVIVNVYALSYNCYTTMLVVSVTRCIINRRNAVHVSGFQSSITH